MSGASSVSHLGICVSNIQRAIVFYENALDFKVVHTFESSGSDFNNLVGFDDFSASYAFLQNAATLIELVHYAKPAVEGSGYRIPLNKAGLSYLCMRVADMDAVCERIEANGGRTYPATRTATPQGNLMFCSDPDGTRIELLQR